LQQLLTSLSLQAAHITYLPPPRQTLFSTKTPSAHKAINMCNF
jgi:hypothetical protein